MTPTGLTFRLIPELQVRRRAVGLLEGRGELDAAANFEDLDENDERDIRSRMEWWVACNNTPKCWFHGFKAEKHYRDCFVFKLPHRRWYGFLCHPQPKSNPRFELCVLCIHAFKYQWKTEKKILRAVNEWRVNLGAIQAISFIHPDSGKEVREWKQ